MSAVRTPKSKGAEVTGHVQHQQNAILVVTTPDDPYCLDWICAVAHVESIRHEVDCSSTGRSRIEEDGSTKRFWGLMCIVAKERKEIVAYWS